MTPTPSESAEKNFKEAFRRTLLLKSSLGLLVVSIILVLACLLPLGQKLKEEQEKNLFFAVKSRSARVDIFLEKAIETTRQFTSRTLIREKLELYNQDAVPLAELVAFTRPKLEDALNLSAEGIAVSRFDQNNRLVVAVGRAIPEEHWRFPADTEGVVTRGPVQINGHGYLVVSAPIWGKDKSRVGTDIALFTTEMLEEVTQDASGFGETGETILGRLEGGQALSFYSLRQSRHNQDEAEHFHQGELDGAFAQVARAPAARLPLLIREGHAMKIGDRIRHTDWIILCRIDKDELYSPINTLILALTLTVGLLLCLGLLGMGRLLRPLADKAIIHSEKLQQELLEKQEALRQREEAQQALNAEKEQLAVTLRSIADGVITTDGNEKIELCNSAAELLLEAKADEARGKPLAEMLPLLAADKKPLPAPYKEILKEFQPEGGGSRVMLRNKCGQEKKLTITHSPMLGEDRASRGTVWVIRDVTEQEQMESRIRQTQKMEAIGTLAAGIAHDFNNILTAILGFSQLVHANLGTETKELQWQEEVINATHRAQELVKQILTFSRQTEHEKKPLDLNPVVKEALKLIRATIPSTIEIRQDIRSGSGQVLADPTQIHQVVMNLCTNAFQSMAAERGTLNISLRGVRLRRKTACLGGELQPGDYVLLQVEDTGPGIDPRILDKIFEPYFTTKGKGQGTGLGLAVVQGIVKNCNGSIQVRNRAEGGASFQLYFPALAAEPAEKTPRPAGAEGLRLRTDGREEILVVDDERPIAELIREILELNGYRAIACSDPLEALDIFSREPGRFAMLIADLSMPKLTGLELAQKCKALSPDLPLLFCSGNGKFSPERPEQGFSFAAFASKPISTEAFTHAVRRLLDARRGKATPPPAAS